MVPRPHHVEGRAKIHKVGAHARPPCVVHLSASSIMRGMQNTGLAITVSKGQTSGTALLQSDMLVHLIWLAIRLGRLRDLLEDGAGELFIARIHSNITEGDDADQVLIAV